MLELLHASLQAVTAVQMEATEQTRISIVQLALARNLARTQIAGPPV